MMVRSAASRPHRHAIVYELTAESRQPYTELRFEHVLRHAAQLARTCTARGSLAHCCIAASTCMRLTLH